MTSRATGRVTGRSQAGRASRRRSRKICASDSPVRPESARPAATGPRTIGTVTDEILPVPADETDAAEAWERLTDEPDVRGVGAARPDDDGDWAVVVWVMEFVRDDPLEDELRQRIEAALADVGGAVTVEEEDRECWVVSGTASGPELIAAAAGVVDDLADRTRPFVDPPE
jgi:hypothetical protein